MAAGSAGDGNLTHTSFQPPTKSVPVILIILLPISLILVVMNHESNCCKLLLKGQEVDKEEIQEGTASLAAAKEMRTDAAVAVVYQKWLVSHD